MSLIEDQPANKEPEPDDGIDRSKMRTGFTTGTSAAVAAKGAALLLRDGTCPDAIEILVPAKVTLIITLKMKELLTPTLEARCSVIKDGGDDPDCTHLAEIISHVRLAPAGAQRPGAICFKAGAGVGTITKPGLELPPGEPAINPVPRKMIAQALTEVLGDDLGGRVAEVEVAIPNGEELAKKTINARLGILGGLSILGVSGIVKPYSTAAFRASVRQGVAVAKARGVQEVFFTTGDRSEKFAMQLFPNHPEEAFIQMGDFVGFALSCGRAVGMKKITLCGMVGKTAKLAQGRLQTHAAGAEVDTKFLGVVAAECGAEPDIVATIQGANTARHVGEIIDKTGVQGFYDNLAFHAATVASRSIQRQVPVEMVLTDFNGKVIGRAHVG